ncbi:hypothetical protein N7470_003493 [Penicillium chermesinum]|nr:hypothetical protein N7470_003493 [Penicillium chermesinum]
MDLSSKNFSLYLPWILAELSLSCFVSIDLEFSGIPLAQPGQARKDCPLTERYAEYKAAAEKYQILQLGLTICHEEPNTGIYVLKPYNINVSPMIRQELGINRDWTLMSCSMEFLMGHNFNMQEVCQAGVRYLSREEEADAIQVAANKFDPEKAAEAVTGKDLDQKHQLFLIQVRHAINTWLANKTKPSCQQNLQEFLNIPGRGRDRRPAFPSSLSNLQRYLVRQLVAAEYPDLKARNKQDFVQIEFKDEATNPDETLMDGREAALRNRIREHVGCRWLVEALAGADLSGLKAGDFASLLTRVTEPRFTLDEIASRVKSRVKENRAILVGHNCFMDLVFLYRCFVGPLPDTLEKFQALIHDVFPFVMDTKYLATHDGNLDNTNSSLEGISSTLAKIPAPPVYIAATHSKYLFHKCAHEAGYDSMLAAVAFIKLATQLQQGHMPKPPRTSFWKGRHGAGDLDLKSTTGIPEATDLLMTIPERDTDPTFEDFSGDLMGFSDESTGSVLTDPKPSALALLSPKPGRSRWQLW